MTISDEIAWKEAMRKGMMERVEDLEKGGIPERGRGSGKRAFGVDKL